jgi:crotonobetainyl-CoA:carnitine CoA-transferase CaiB-like acyl-CoA transferase
VHDVSDGRSGPLDGIRVIDLTRARAGPTCVRQLADLGADVIQVADPSGGDLSGSDAANLHRNKRSTCIDLSRPEGRDVFLRMVDRADVLVENFRPAVKHRLRIDYETLGARNPRLVYASLSGFGQTGPYADRPGIDQIAQGMGGLMGVTGPPGTGPWRAGIAVSDTVAGTFLAQGVLAALVARHRTGRGQWIHTSLLETMVNLMDFQAVRWLNDGVVPRQEGNSHPTVAGMGTYATADGWLNIAMMSNWPGFCEALDAPELADDARFAMPEDRRRHHHALETVIGERLAARSNAAWIERFVAADLPVGPVYRLDEVFADEQVAGLQLRESVDHPSGTPVSVLRGPVTFSDTPSSIRRGVPAAGADTVEVLGELGYTEGEIEQLVADGLVRLDQPPPRWSTR